MSHITLQSFGDSEHRLFAQQGYLRLGRMLDDRALAALQERIDAIMLGQVRYEGMRFQLDSDTGVYGDVPPMAGHTEATLNYRRVDDLEKDPLFLAHMRHPLFHQITRRYIGEEVSVFRSMFMNKPAHKGTELPWHQDVGYGWGLDSDPTITVWTALDDATVANGCMQIVPGSHRLGVLNPGHFTSEEDLARHAPVEKILDLEVGAGEAVLLNNLLLHRSGTNPSGVSRRAFSAAYMDASTRRRHSDECFPLIFGTGVLSPH